MWIKTKNPLSIRMPVKCLDNKAGCNDEVIEDKWCVLVRRIYSNTIHKTDDTRILP